MNEIIEEIKVKYNVNSMDELTERNWMGISMLQKLSEEFIREYQDRVNWKCISINQKLSESFIREFKDRVEWFHISYHQKLSESIIREFKDKVKWTCIVYKQKISEEFIREFKDKVDWSYLICNKHFSDEMLHNLSDINHVKKWVRKCGKYSRTIFRTKEEPNIIVIGCWSGSEEEAIEAIDLKYEENTPEALEYINKVRECFRD